MFFTFHQNNSGGWYDGPACVCVEADTAAKANERAESELAVYFDGVSTGDDCGCCGDRWFPVDDQDGYDVPSRYGEPTQASKDFRIVYAALA